MGNSTSHNHSPRKRFGQNFLHDHGIISRIARSIRAKESDHVVEIGPGKGALTEEIIASGCRLDAIELDRDLVPILLSQFVTNPRFKLHQGDALKFDFNQLIDDEQPLRIVGNLPYNISTPLIFHLLNHYQHIHDMHFMLQLEVVDRLAAQPGTKTYGRLGIMAQYYCKVESLFEVPPDAFTPRPKVQSAVVRLSPYEKPPYPADDVELLQTVLRTVFNQRRKTLRNTLKGLITEQQFEELGINPIARPETLSLEQFVTISNTIHQTKDDQ